MKDFRLISLVGGLYKWLPKVLANRLKLLLGKLISKVQHAFVEGRQILDASLIANEAIDSVLKSKVRAVLCKLGIERAYDHVDWAFLFSVIGKMGFGEKWIGWVKWCLSPTSVSILVNGTPVGFFQSSRGLRQGDPLSPYLFVIAMEALSCMLKRAVEGGFLTPCQVKGKGSERVDVSHFLFANDTLIFCKASKDDMTHLDWLFMCFEAISGLKINLEKSELFLVGTGDDAEDLAFEVGCKVGSLPSTYLGLPLGAAFKSMAAWDRIEERLRIRLAMWKRI